MKALREQQKGEWRCDRCHRVTDTLYFAGKLNICGDCRDDDRRRRRADGSGYGHGARNGGCGTD